jgi:leucyl aminopeptidase
MTGAFELMRAIPAEVDVVVIGTTTDAVAARASTSAPAAPADGAEIDWAFVRARGFEGRADQVQSLPSGGDGRAVVLVGLGPAASVDAGVVRRAAATAARAVTRATSVALTLLDQLPAEAGPTDRARAAQALVEGFTLGGYQFRTYKSETDPSGPERVVVVGTGGQRIQTALELGSAVAAGVTLARDLVNEPGGSLTAEGLAATATELAGRTGLGVAVLDERAIADERLGGLLGVNRGSTQPPRFITLTHVPDRPRGHVALVGKGITFDSGGLSLKTGAGMMTMKCDMGGAAAILGAMSVIPLVAGHTRVTAYLPATDNMPGPDATRPGDVLKIRNGKTVEVLNTDAEGRLVLADALSLAVEDEPDAIIDLATLTGAAESALGNRIAALMGNDRPWGDQVLEAAARAGERVWPLPLPDDYRKRLDSDVADLRNISRTTDGGAITAGLFLREFVGSGVAWAHLDIAGPAWSNDVDGELTRGGTGFGVRTLVELVRTFKRPR